MNNWVRSAMRLYTEHTDGGEIAFGRVGKGLKALVDREGWDRVGPAWAHFLTVTENRFCTPEYFARTFGDWVVTTKVTRTPPQFREILDGQRFRLVPDGPESAA